MAEVVNIAIPANALAAAEALGLTVSRSVIDGAHVRRIPRDEAEIAIACLQDYGYVAWAIGVSPKENHSLPVDTRQTKVAAADVAR